MTVFDYVAFGAMGIVFCFIVFLVIFLGDLPGKIGRERKHPQLTALTALSWFGLLFTGGLLWIVAMVWALYDYSSSVDVGAATELRAEIEGLRARLEALEGSAEAEEAS